MEAYKVWVENYFDFATNVFERTAGLPETNHLHVFLSLRVRTPKTS